MTTVFSTAAWAIATALLLPAAPSARADTVYDNLSSAQDGSDPVFGYGPLANSFTSNAGGRLTGINALLANGSPAIIGTLRWSLHADAGTNAPGAELASLGLMSSAAVSGSFASYGFAPSAAITLTAGTRYWIELEALAPNAVAWSWSGDTTATGVTGEFNYSALLGSSSNAAYSPYQMAVTVTPVPEPASAWLAGLGLAILSGTVRQRRR